MTRRDKSIQKNFKRGIKMLETGYKVLFKETDIDDDEMEKLKNTIIQISRFYTK